MTSPYEDVIEGQSKLMERYEEALKAIFDNPHELPRQWALYGLTGGSKPVLNGSANRKDITADRIRVLEEHIKFIIQNDRDDIVADGGVTVFDAWAQQAAFLITSVQGGGKNEL